MVDSVAADWTVDIWAVLPEGWRVDAVAGTQGQPKTISCNTPLYQDAYGGPTSADINPAFYDLVPSLRWDSRVTIGAIDASGDPYPENVLQTIGIDWTPFENGGDLSVTDGTWFVLPTDGQGEVIEFTSGDCDVQHGVLLARLTPTGQNAMVTFEALLQGRNAEGNNWQASVSHDVSWSATQDCNANGVPDTCDIANGTSDDANGDGIPDECASCPGDYTGDGEVTVDDVLAVISGFGGEYGVDDLLTTLAFFGSDC